MKLEITSKLINGVIYNIEASEKIAVGTNLALDCEATVDELRYYAESTSQFVAEVLYKTTDSEYFIYGMGGNCSDYAQPYVTGMGAGSDIWLIDKDEIPSWMEAYNLIDEFRHFIEK